MFKINCFYPYHQFVLIYYFNQSYLQEIALINDKIDKCDASYVPRHLFIRRKIKVLATRFVSRFVDVEQEQNPEHQERKPFNSSICLEAENENRAWNKREESVAKADQKRRVCDFHSLLSFVL